MKCSFLLAKNLCTTIVIAINVMLLEVKYLLHVECMITTTRASFKNSFVSNLQVYQSCYLRILTSIQYKSSVRLQF